MGADGKFWLKVIGGGAALLIGLFGWMYLREKNISDHGRSRVVTARRQTLADGKAVIVLVESVLHPGGEDPDSFEGRLDVVDAQTGKRIARKPGVDAGDCLAAGAGRMWCDEANPNPPRERGIVLRDIATLETRASEDQLRLAVPALGKGIESSRQHMFVDPDGGAAVVPINDGSFWAIDPAACPACKAQEIKLDDKRPRVGFGHKMPMMIAGERELGFAGRGKQTLVRRGDGKDTPVGTVEFLDPSFLGDSDTPDPLHGNAMLLEGAIRLVVHADTLDRATATTLLTALDERGVAHWKVDLGKGKPLAAFHLRAPDLVIIAMQADESWVVALDPATGQVRWRYDA